MHVYIPYMCIFISMLLAIECAGIYERQFVCLHEDRSAGSTTAKKLWSDVRKQKQDNSFHVICDCCEDYKSWTEKHPANAAQLQRCADETKYYKAFPKKVVRVVKNGKEVWYTGTIYSANCSITALKFGTSIPV